ncbi:MAG TPA: hypothetical protein VI981_05535 [Candidatus Paceibacterota bacterium]
MESEKQALLEAVPSKVEGVYVPVGVPAELPRHKGRIQAYLGLACGLISIILFPPVFGIAGIILGIAAINRGEKVTGAIAVVISSVFMIAGFALGMYVSKHPDIFKSGSYSTGAVYEALL